MNRLWLGLGSVAVPKRKWEKRFRPPIYCYSYPHSIAPRHTSSSFLLQSARSQEPARTQLQSSTMASSTMLSFNLRLCLLHFPPTARLSQVSAQLSPLNKLSNSLRLSSSNSISGSLSFLSRKPSTITPLTQRLQSLTVTAAKGYKMKTHKVNFSVFLLFVLGSCGLRIWIICSSSCCFLKVELM